SLAIDEGRRIMGLAMEYVAGVSLDQKLRAAHGPLPLAEVFGAGIAVCAALGAVHRAGIVHRDVKPANVVDASGVYKLIDFGVAIEGERKSRVQGQKVVLDDLPLESLGTKMSMVMNASGSFYDLCGTVGYI